MKTTKKYALALAAIVGLAAMLIWHNHHSRLAAMTGGAVADAGNHAAVLKHPMVLSASAPQSSSPSDVQILEQIDLAPTWAVKYGEEFWHRSASELAKTARPNDVHSAATPPFSLGDVMERVNHALVAGKNSAGPEVAAGNYLARFDGQRLQLSPYLPATEPLATPALDPATEINFHTVAIQRDGNSIYSAATDAVEWSAVGNTAQALLSKDWGVVEHYETQNSGVGVAWIFPTALPGSGAIEVTASVTGLIYEGQTESGFHYADANGIARVRISNAFAVDAAGNRWELPMEVAQNSGQLTVTLPADIQTRAVYPLAIDPIVGPEFGMDKAVLSPASGSQGNPAVASMGTNYLVVWDDSRDSTDTGKDIFGARVTVGGVIKDPVGIAICRANGTQSTPAVAVVSNMFLVVWNDQRLGSSTIFGARVSNLGVVQDAQGFALSASQVGQFNPTVAAGATNYFVAWEDDRNSSTNGTDIYGTRVNVAGVVLDPAGIAITTDPADQTVPTVVGNSSAFFVAWQDTRNSGTTGTDIYGARVSKTGVLLDTNGVALSTANSSQTVPSTAANGGMVLVVWQDRRTSGSTSDDIYGTRINFTNNTVNVLDTNGIAISTDSASQRTPVVCALTNNFLVVWSDRRNNSTNSYDIFGARVDTNGLVLEPTGFAVCDNFASQTAPAIASTATGALVAWTDGRNSTSSGNDIYGARISNAGVLLDTNSVAISLAGAVEANPVVAFNGTNYLVAWEDSRNFAVSDVDIRGTRISSSGVVRDVAGINICNQAAAQRHPSVAASGGEFLVAWADARNALSTGVDIYGTRISGTGAVMDSSGLSLSTAANDEAAPAVAGNASKFLIAWEDNRNSSTSPDIFGTLVSQSGIVANPSGILISQTGGSEMHPAIAASASQFLVAWDDGSDVYAARVANNGTVLDTSGSALQLANLGNESNPSVASLGANFLIAWADNRNSTADIFAGRVLSDGTVPDFEGAPICTLPNNQVNPVVGATSNTWLVVWQSGGTLDGNDLYCARVGPNGFVQDYLSVPIIGTADWTAPQLAFGGNKFLVVSDAFRTNSERVVGSLVSVNPILSNPLVQFSASSYTVMETVKFAKVVVTLSGKFTGVITVDFSTSDGTAVAGIDYMPVAGRLVFSGKQVSTTVLIPIINDLAVEPNKTINLNLQNPMGGALIGSRNTATLTIVE